MAIDDLRDRHCEVGVGINFVELDEVDGARFRFYSVERSRDRPGEKPSMNEVKAIGGLVWQNGCFNFTVQM
jgi:hypothetical protein